MTEGAEIRSDQPVLWPEFLLSEVADRFARAGWTPEDWQDADDESNTFLAITYPPWVAEGNRELLDLSGWLRDPPDELGAVSPAVAWETIATFSDSQVPRVLDAYAAGASTRFVAQFIARYPSGPPIKAWTSATAWCDLDEPAAIGWLMTGLLYQEPDAEGVTGTHPEAKARISAWTDRLGPRAYLYLFAKFTLDEAITLAVDGVSPSEAELRVMVALNGVDLPAGI